MAWDFGQADLLDSEAIGDPGQRRFRLRIKSGPEAASLWLEKEQLTALTIAIRQLLEQTGGDPQAEAEAASPQDVFPDDPQVDFQLGRLGIGYDEAERMVTVFAYTTEDAEDASPTFSCRVSRGQCHAFAIHAEEVISAGRPTCVLCGGPIDRGQHKCLRRNGHAQTSISLE